MAGVSISHESNKIFAAQIGRAGIDNGLFRAPIGRLIVQRMGRVPVFGDVDAACAPDFFVALHVFKETRQ
jgi:hypothetical protein